jgi:acetyl-CoA C-acetyltransferase
MGLDNLALMKYADLTEIRHIHHAGNSSQITDGAAGILIGSKEIGEKLGLTPRAKFKAFGVTGSEPTIMLTGPVPAAQKVLSRAGMSINDIDLFEVNEAFAVVPMFFMDQLNVHESKVNVNGGAIAMGHPLGATGAIILMTLLDELERQGKGTGLATLCVGAGMGIATVIERI